MHSRQVIAPRHGHPIAEALQAALPLAIHILIRPSQESDPSDLSALLEATQIVSADPDIK